MGGLIDRGEKKGKKKINDESSQRASQSYDGPEGGLQGKSFMRTN